MTKIAPERRTEFLLSPSSSSSLVYNFFFSVIYSLLMKLLRFWASEMAFFCCKCLSPYRVWVHRFISIFGDVNQKKHNKQPFDGNHISDSSCAQIYRCTILVTLLQFLNESNEIRSKKKVKVSQQGPKYISNGNKPFFLSLLNCMRIVPFGTNSHKKRRYTCIQMYHSLS